MKSKTIVYGIILIVLVLIIWIGMDTFSQPGIRDLEGTYSEVASYRNENNTGPILRIYAVHAADTLWRDMEAYGNFMPHTKYGNTKVYFFSDPGETPPQVNPEPPHFGEQYEKYCMAIYEKSAMGETSFTQYPFRQKMKLPWHPKR